MNLSNTVGLAFVAIGAVVLLVPLLLGGLFVVVVVANRAEPDPTSRRPASVYTFATAFVTIFVTLFASYAAVNALCQLIGTNHMEGDAIHPVGDAVTRAAVLATIIGLVAGVTWLLHVRAGRRLSEGEAGGPNWRVRSSYAAAVSFLSVAVAVIALIAAIYTGFTIISPAIFGSGSHNRVAPLRSLIPLAYLALAALALLRGHLKFAPPGLRGSLGRSGPPPEQPAAAATAIFPAVDAPAPRPPPDRTEDVSPVGAPAARPPGRTEDVSPDDAPARPPTARAVPRKRATKSTPRRGAP